MKTLHRSLGNNFIEQNFAPQWTFKSVIYSVLVTIFIYLILPYIDKISIYPGKDIVSRNLNSIHLPPPLPRPLSKVEKDNIKEKIKAPKPEIIEMHKKLEPLKNPVNLNMALENINGDFSLDFWEKLPNLNEEIKDLIFEINELDEPPKLLTFLNPVYPYHAQRRKIEGEVLLEFYVDAKGSVENIHVISFVGEDVFINPAVNAIKGCRFVPGKKDGIPVVTRVHQNIVFRLK